MDYTISYKKVRHGYARLSHDGKLSITIPYSLKDNESFKNNLIEKGKKLLSKHHKRTHIQSHTSDSILLFGEHVAISQLPITNKPITYLKSTLHEYIQPIADKYSDLIGKSYKEIKIRKLKSKRGSCSHDNVLTFNLDLIHLQTKYIKYVIIHEVCHIRVKNHSSRFRDLVAQYCPDYKKLRKELRNFIIR